MNSRKAQDLSDRDLGLNSWLMIMLTSIILFAQYIKDILILQDHCEDNNVYVISTVPGKSYMFNRLQLLLFLSLMK